MGVDTFVLKCDTEVDPVLHPYEVGIIYEDLLRPISHTIFLHTILQYCDKKTIY
jgi:hypothetical protein